METQKQENNQESRVGAELAVLNDTATDIHAELTAINANLAAALESLQVMEEKQHKMAKDLKSIKTVAVFFLILTLISLIPVASLFIRTCTGG